MKVNSNRVVAAVSPVGVSDGKVRLGESLVQIRRDVNLDSELLVQARSLRVGSRYQYTRVRKESSLRMIHAWNNGSIQN